MLDKWLAYNARNPNKFCFSLIDVSEKAKRSNRLKGYLSKEVLESYRNIDALKKLFENKTEKALRDYLDAYVFPDAKNTINKNVRQGDFGEILAGLIVAHFCGLVIPIHKLRWKFNSNRSVFCTDMIAHNSGQHITDIYYYEVKSRLNIQKEAVKKVSNYVTVNAHNALLKDEQGNNEGIADFLFRLHAELENFDESLKYGEIVTRSAKFVRHFELFFIIEQSAYIEDILDDLNNLPPSLAPINVTIVLLDGLNNLVVDVINHAKQQAVDIVFNGK